MLFANYDKMIIYVLYYPWVHVVNFVLVSPVDVIVPPSPRVINSQGWRPLNVFNLLKVKVLLL